MLRIYSMIVGIILLAVGVIAFFPQIAPHDFLFGIFHLNHAHNWFHIGLGVLSLLCGFLGEKASRYCFQFYGIGFTIVAMLGIYFGNQLIFGMISSNLPDTIIHTLLAVSSFYLGFIYR